MRFTTEGPPALQVAGLAVLLLISGFVVMHLVDRPADRTAPAGTAAPPAPPPGADDPSNRPIFVEGGTFLRGSDHPGKSDDPASPFHTGDEDPVRRAGVASFWMQEHEVTNEEYRRFDPAHEFPSGRERHPVVDVTWREAMEYALSVGGRLPTEWEWEYAAEGTENRTYPWGDAPPTCDRAHYGDCDPPGAIEVMSRPDGATPAGIHDLAGNVWEWVMPVWFEPGRTPVNDDARRMRGGSFAEEPFFLRASNRNNGFFEGHENSGVGFRVVWPAAFERERELLQPVLEPWLTGPIEHIGSTAVPGLLAKPVIDIMAAVEGLDASRGAIPAVEDVGYRYAPYRPEVMHWFCKPSPSHRTHHLHLVPFGSRLWIERLAFRDCLRRNRATAEAYAELKERLARRHEFDREAYTDAKTPFVRRVVERALAGRSDPS